MEVERRTFKKYTYRGIELKDLLEMKQENLVDLLSARQRRKMNRGLKHKYLRFLKKVRQAVKDAPQGEKPKAVKSHLRNMIVLPEMVHSVIAIYNGKAFASVEIKPDMVGHYLGEFAITYKPVKHGRPGIGATHSSRFIPLK